jgi:hypothetical protein
VEGSQAFRAQGETAILTSGPINTLAYNFINFKMRVMAVAVSPIFGLGGLDDDDYIRVEISPDNGLTWYNTLEVRGGGSGASWNYLAGGVAAGSYDANNVPAQFGPQGGGLRTTDGYSTITLYHLPKSASLRIRITLYNDWGFFETPERWVIDDMRLLGTDHGPLPVKFGTLSAVEKSNGVELQWTSFFEEQVASYTVERSTNGQDFITIGNRSPANAGAVATQYEFIDAFASRELFFYRVKYTDHDGKHGFSQVIRVSTGMGGPDIVFYPNPVVNRRVNFQARNLDKGSYSLLLADMNGSITHSESFQHKGGLVSRSIQLPERINGTFIAELHSKGKKISSKLLLIH